MGRALLTAIAGLTLLAASEGLQRPSLTPADAGSVQGQVLDSEGRSVPNAKVRVEPANRPSGRARFAYSDPSGKFRIDSLAPGAYTLHASKEDEGYPENYAGFFADDPDSVLRVEVLPGKTTGGVRARLGAKGAKLSGRVTDSRTGEPLTRAQVTLRRGDAPYWVSFAPRLADARFSILVPSNKPFSVSVSAEGYDPWEYTGAGKTKFLRLSPGGEKFIAARLKVTRIREQQ